MIHPGHRFLPKKKDIRQWSHQSAFGSIAPPNFPKTLGRKALAIYDQLSTQFCTAFAYAADASLRNGFVISPEYQVAQEGKVALAPILDGATLDIMCKAGFDIGVVRDEECPIKLATSDPTTVADWTKYPTLWPIPQGWYYTAHTGKYDAFDNIRSTIMNARANGQEVAVIMATYWYNEFNEAARAKQPMPVPTRRDIADHAYVFLDWYDDVALCQLSSGNDFGNDGILEFPRAVINLLFANPLADTRVIDVRHISDGSWRARVIHELISAYLGLVALYEKKVALSIAPTPTPTRETPVERTPEAPADPSPTIPESEAHPPNLDVFCTAIRDYEGGPNDLNYRNNNPGNFRCSPVGYDTKYGQVKCVNDFSVFPTYALGWAYLRNIVKERVTAHPNWTFLDFFKVYAPAGDDNDPAHYAAFVAKRCGVPVDSSVAAFVA